MEGFAHPEVVSRILKKIPEILATPVTLPKLSYLFKRDIDNEAQKEPFAQLVLQGKLEPGRNSAYAIDGVEFQIPPGIWICGTVELGKFAKVRYSIDKKGQRLATSIVMA